MVYFALYTSPAVGGVKNTFELLSSWSKLTVVQGLRVLQVDVVGLFFGITHVSETSPSCQRWQIILINGIIYHYSLCVVDLKPIFVFF